MNSRAKGKAGELEAVHALEEMLGVPARRGQQYRGTADSPDIVIPSLPALYIEVKRRQNLNVAAALDQAWSEARDEQIPLVMHRRNREPWCVTVRLSSLLALVRELRLLAATSAVLDSHAAAPHLTPPPPSRACSSTRSTER